MAENEGMVDHLKGFFDASDKLKSTGANLDDDLLAIMLLHSLPASFENFRCAIESRDNLPDLEILKIKILEEYKSRYRGDESNQNSTMFAKPQQSSSHTTGGANSQSASSSSGSQKRQKPKYKCGYCGIKGHKEANCFKKKKSLKGAKDEQSGLCFLTGETSKDKWCLDSGSTSHVCSDKNSFKNKTYANFSLQLDSDATTAVRAKGDVNIISKNDARDIILKNTLYVPNLRTNLISIAKVVDAGFNLYTRAERIGDLFYLKGTEKPPHVSALAKASTDMYEWHARLKHLNSKDLKATIGKGHTEGIENVIIKDISNCNICAVAKKTSTPFQPRTQYASKPLEVIHTDVCEPMRTTSKGGARWFVTFIDEHTRWCSIYFMKQKNEVTEKFIEYKNLVENQTEHKIKALHSVCGKEYDNGKLDKILRDSGIQRRFTVPYTPQQNGMAERKNRTVVEVARCLLTQSGLPTIFWAEAIHTANYIRNRCFTETISCTPFEKWTGRKPDISHIRSFGEKVYVLNKNPARGKFDPRGLEGIFLGYTDDSKSYRIWLVDASKVISSRDVKFSQQEVKCLINNDTWTIVEKPEMPNS